MYNFFLTFLFTSLNLFAGDCLKKNQLGKFVEIPTGTFTMRSQPKYIEENGTQKVKVDGFLLQIHEVTNSEFAKFIAATGYKTSAERKGNSALFSASKAQKAKDPSQWWKLSKNTTWWTPEGNDSNLKDKDMYPVVQVSYEDAKAYAKWAKARLLTEKEWEYAATLGLFDPNEPDSGAIGPNGEPRANIWNGKFPDNDSGRDGFKGLAPIGCFPVSKIGTYDMIGNVWEWTSTPFGGNRYTIKGGSHLCSQSYCHRYRTAARQGVELDFSTNHIGFRIAKDLPKDKKGK